MTTHSSVLAWRIPGTGEPGGLPSMGSHRVRQDWSDLAAAAVKTEKAMAPHSKYSCLENPWTGEPGRLQSMGSRRVGHNWETSLYFSLSCTGEGNGNPRQCSFLENPREGGRLVGCRLWGRTESDRTEATQQQQQYKYFKLFFILALMAFFQVELTDFALDCRFPFSKLSPMCR